MVTYWHKLLSKALSCESRGSAYGILCAAGTAVDVISEGTCGRFLVKGYVEEEQTAGGNGTAVALSIKAGTLRDCAGNVFPAASAAGTVSDRCLSAVSSTTRVPSSAWQSHMVVGGNSWMGYGGKTIT